MRECKFCGCCQDVPGSSTYSGAGIFEYLNDLTRDPPLDAETGFGNGTGRFSVVPRPPSGWLGLQTSELENGEAEPEDGFGDAEPYDLDNLKNAILKVYDNKYNAAVKAAKEAKKMYERLSTQYPSHAAHYRNCAQTQGKQPKMGKLRLCRLTLDRILPVC